MRLVLIPILLLSIQFLTGCARRPTGDPVPADVVPTENETVAYSWQKYRVEVGFHRVGTNRHWYMTVRDSWSVLDQSLQPNGKSWDDLDSRCSRIEGLRIIDESLARFLRARPNANVTSMHIEMQVISDLWRDLLTEVAAAMTNAHGEKDGAFSDSPPELLHRMPVILNDSSTITQLKGILQTRGFRVGYVGTAVPIRFKDSLDGLEWSEVAHRPDLGIFAPGIVEVDLELK